MGRKTSFFFDGLRDIEFLPAFPMKNLTSFRIGGPADVYFPKDEGQLARLMQRAAETDTEPFIMGNGSNLLVSDEGIAEPVICMKKLAGPLAFEGDSFTADAGSLLGYAAKQSVEHGLSGLEWACGIPGSVGGAIAMNAGAYEGEIAQVVSEVTYLDEDGSVRTAKPRKADFSYRKSAFSAPERIILRVRFQLSGDDGSAQARMQAYNAWRIDKQPLSYPSAGSVFKRPAGHYAGALIEAAGMKGARVGGAQVSELHAGFIINTGDASCKDVLALIAQIRARVLEMSGVRLECEIKTAGIRGEEE